MKKTVFVLLAAVLAAALLAGCGHGGPGDETEDYSDLTVVDSKTVKYSDLGMSAYTLSTSNRRVADAIVVENESQGIVVRAYGQGKATITVTDYWGRTGEVEVTVSEKNVISEAKVISSPDDGGIDFKAFSVAGGGSSDAEKLQSAVNELKKKGGGTLYIPAGKYHINSTIILGGNIDIELQGSVENAKDGYTDELKKRISDGEFAVLTAPMFINHDPAGSGSNGAGGITIHGGVMDMQGYLENGAQIDVDQVGPAVGRTKNNVMIFSCASGLRFEDVITLDIYNGHAFQLTGCSDVLIRNCLFAGYVIQSETKGYDKSVVTTRETIQIEYAHSGAIPPSFFEEGEYYFCSNVEITGCCFTKSDRAGYHEIPIGQHGMNGIPNCTGVIIRDNVFDNPYIYGIRLLSYRDVEISGNTFISSLPSTGHSKKNCMMIYIPLQSSDKTYSGTMKNGKAVNIVYRNSWEQDGTKNVAISGNTFEICKNSYFKVMKAVSNNLDIGARSVYSQIRQASGQLYGEVYTGFLPAENVIDGLSFTGNTVRFGGKPANTDDWIEVFNVRNFSFADNDVSGYDGFTESAGGVTGMSESNNLNGNDAKTRVIEATLTDKTVTLSGPSGEKTTLVSDGNKRVITLLADDGVKGFAFSYDNGNLSVSVELNEGYSFSGWKTVSGQTPQKSGTTSLSGDITLSAATAKK